MGFSFIPTYAIEMLTTQRYGSYIKPFDPALPGYICPTDGVFLFEDGVLAITWSLGGSPRAVKAREYLDKHFGVKVVLDTALPARLYTPDGRRVPVALPGNSRFYNAATAIVDFNKGKVWPIARPIPSSAPEIQHIRAEFSLKYKGAWIVIREPGADPEYPPGVDGVAIQMLDAESEAAFREKYVAPLQAAAMRLTLECDVRPTPAAYTAGESVHHAQMALKSTMKTVNSGEFDKYVERQIDAVKRGWPGELASFVRSFRQKQLDRVVADMAGKRETFPYLLLGKPTGAQTDGEVT